MRLAEIIVDDFGGAPFATHNFPCPVCLMRKAVLDMDGGRFYPCDGCHKHGWVMVRVPRWFIRLAQVFG